MSEHRLNEIVIERPRAGIRCSYRKIKGVKKKLSALTKEATDEGLLSPYLIKTQRNKGLTDHLGPLRRFLKSKVGYPWDDVYSELCQRLKTNTMTGQHVLSHVFDYVELHVEIIDGIPYRKACHQFRRSNPWFFFVHPQTGFLCTMPKIPQSPAKKTHDLIVIDVYKEYRLIDGLWYCVTFEDLPSLPNVRDMLLNCLINPQLAQKKYGRLVYAVRKHQCGKREIKFIQSKLFNGHVSCDR